MEATARSYISEQNYLEGERVSEIRHEYLDGEVYAMSGGSFEHVLIRENFSGSIYQQLIDTPCRSASSDLRVLVEETRFYCYPDYIVFCGEPKRPEGDDYSLLNPVVVVEVLSPSTENRDRTIKLDHFRKIPSLKQCILVAQDSMRVELYTPTETGWLLEVFTESSQTIKLAVGAEITLQAIYRGIELPEPLPLEDDKPRTL